MATAWQISYSASPSDLGRGTGSARLLDSLHMLRDGNSFNFLNSCVAERFSDCGLILNLPPGIYAKEGPQFSKQPPISSEDLLILATRPPLEDDGEMDLRSITKSGSDLEEAIFDQLSKVFDHCNRKQVLLSESLVRNLKGEARNYSAVQFNVKNNAFYNRHGYVKEGPIHTRLDRLERIKPKKLKKTLGYLIYIPDIPFNDGLSLLTSFGMNGTSNLLWNFIVKTYLCDDVRKIVTDNQPHIIVGEFSLNLPDDQRPSYISPDLVSPPRKIIDMDFELH